MHKVTRTVIAAQRADDAFDAAIRDAGYKSRWDWSKLTDDRPLAAYRLKIAADAAMHDAFAEARSAETPRDHAAATAYAADCEKRPCYHDGMPRVPWHRLCPIAQESWRRGLPASTES